MEAARTNSSASITECVMTIHFADVQAAAPQSGTVVLMERAPEGHSPVVEYLNSIAGVLWPLLLIAVIWALRRELRRIAKSVAERVENPNSKLVIGPFELSLASRVESLELDHQVVSGPALLGRSESAVRPPAESIPAELLAEAEQYLHVEISDWKARVDRKDEIAAAMARRVIGENVSRRALAESPNEGIRMALATAIHVDSRENDDFWILQAAPRIKHLHVRYRFLMAVARLADRRLLRAEFVAPMRTLCFDYVEGADASLLTRIQRTRAALDQYQP